MSRARKAPLIIHVVYRFDVGGLENGVVNLINRLPEGEFRHAVLALTQCSPEFRRRIVRKDVELIALNKPPGHGWRVFRPIWRVFRRARPAIVHTRNLAALEMQLPAALAGVPVRVHGEHGRDTADPHGTSTKHRLIRRAFSPFVTHYVALSTELRDYLVEAVGIADERISRICNGVDEARFVPAATRRFGAVPDDGSPLVIGTVGRLEGVKAQALLVAAIGKLIADGAVPRQAVKLRIVGEGPMRGALEREISEGGLGDVVELLGGRDDVAPTMQAFDVFVLPSLAEGISNTVLEAMACGLPVVATGVGGNVDIVDDGETGTLVPPSDVTALAGAIARYAGSAALREAHGRNGRLRVERELGLSRMVDAYRNLYRSAMSERLAAAARLA